jgi:DNA-binding transcriptional LysR family regulator
MVAVAAGLGLALVPEYVERFIPPTLVLRRLDHKPQPWLENIVVYRKDDELPALTFFLNVLRKHRDNGQWLRRVADA